MQKMQNTIDNALELNLLHKVINVYMTLNGQLLNDQTERPN